jgi:hypothetical protein
VHCGAIDPLIGAVFGLDDAAAALRTLAQHQAFYRCAATTEWANVPTVESREYRHSHHPERCTGVFARLPAGHTIMTS